MLAGISPENSLFEMIRVRSSVRSPIEAGRVPARSDVMLPVKFKAMTFPENSPQVTPYHLQWSEFGSQLDKRFERSREIELLKLRSADLSLEAKDSENTKVEDITKETKKCRKTRKAAMFVPPVVCRQNKNAAVEAYASSSTRKT
uniref:Uncharacterized protein n=1 Tax=Rhizophora mucronata TaxID=61149 RepID=A0A2P2IKM7_RHIMU